MKHTLNLTLKTNKIEGNVTCDDHDICVANSLIKQDAEDIGRYCEYPNFLEWYDGPLTPVRSGAIHLEPFDRFVKWSYVEDTDSTGTALTEDSERGWFYAPVMKPHWGIVHNLHSTDPNKTENDVADLEECLIGFIPTYLGPETDYRPGHITLVQTGDKYFGEEELCWTYSS